MAAAGKVSEMIFNTMEAETRSLVRKVGLNPNVYTGYNFLKARGDARAGKYGFQLGTCVCSCGFLED